MGASWWAGSPCVRLDAADGTLLVVAFRTRVVVLAVVEEHVALTGRSASSGFSVLPASSEMFIIQKHKFTCGFVHSELSRFDILLGHLKLWQVFGTTNAAVISLDIVAAEAASLGI